MRLVGFIIRIYHDARSPERQIYPCTHCIYSLCKKLSLEHTAIHNLTLRHSEETAVLKRLLVKQHRTCGKVRVKGTCKQIRK